MTKIDTTPIEEMHRHLCAEVQRLEAENFALAAWQCLFHDGKTGLVSDEWGNQYCAKEREIAMLREVNRAQADNYTNLARQLAEREEQLRKAQERIRATEEKCDLLNKAHAQMQKTMDRLVAERDRAWNEAIEAAQAVCWKAYDDFYDNGEAGGASRCADLVGELAKGAGE